LIPDFSGKFSRRIENTSKSSLQPSVLLAFLLVSRNQTFPANFDIPNEGIEQIARKNDGASANKGQRPAQGRQRPEHREVVRKAQASVARPFDKTIAYIVRTNRLT
jgi:hypothetical protein